MSILIKGMEMPKNCDDCFLGNYYCERCEHEDGYHMVGGRPYYCPLIEVVRCKDCWYSMEGKYGLECALLYDMHDRGDRIVPEDGYCNRGKRKEGQR